MSAVNSVSRGAARLTGILTLVVPMLVAFGVSPGAAAPPNNDSPSTPRILSFSTISGASGASNVDATKVGEPTPSCANVGATIWWRYTPRAPVTVTMNTNGSATDTVMAAYSSGDLGLKQVACDDDGGDGSASAVSFKATSGTAYYIQIGGFNGATGSITFNYSFHLTHDAFASASSIKPGFAAGFNTALASTGTQSGEPTGCSGPISNTVWYKFRPGSDRRVSFDTFESNFDTKVAVYTGSSLAGLNQVTCADDTDGPNGNASVTWTALKDQLYRIQVGGYPHSGAPGWGELRVNFVRLP